MHCSINQQVFVGYKDSITNFATIEYFTASACQKHIARWLFNWIYSIFLPYTFCDNNICNLGSNQSVYYHSGVYKICSNVNALKIKHQNSLGGINCLKNYDKRCQSKLLQQKAHTNTNKRETFSVLQNFIHLTPIVICNDIYLLHLSTSLNTIDKKIASMKGRAIQCTWQ